MAIIYMMAMDEKTFTLDDLVEATGIEARTIRSYIERGLLPSAQSRGRAASYTTDHLDRLRVIKVLRRAWPNLALSDIRIRLQQLSAENIRALAEGRISAIAATDATEDDDDGDVLHEDDDDDTDPGQEHQRKLGTVVERGHGEPVGAQRLVHALRKVTRYSSPTPTSKAETWHRIAVTEDIELSVRTGFSDIQLGAFRELADLLRDLLTRTEAVPLKTEE
jgi:DNA-binding transcriptional MerR regulator